MRLLLISPAPLRGGAEEYVLTIGMAAKRRGWAVSAALPATDGTLSLSRDLSATGIVLRPLPCIDPWSGQTAPTTMDLLRATRETIQMIRGARPAVVHVTLAWPSFAYFALLAPAVLGIPTVVVFALVPQQIDLPYPTPLYRWTQGRRQRWVAVSENGRGVLAGRLRLPVSRLDVIHNGAPPAGREVVRPDDRDNVRASVRRELDLPQASRLVLSVGRLDPQKAHEELCAATAPLIRDQHDLHLLIAGEGPERASIERLARKQGLTGKLRLLGRRDDVMRLMAAADLFAFPSHFEGFPLALVEAMASGLPLVTSRFPGAEELVRAGRDGLMVPVGDVRALRGAVEWALDHSDEMAIMAQSAQNRAAEFSERRMVDRTLSLLAKCGKNARSH